MSAPVLISIDVETTGIRGNHLITQVGAYALDLPTRKPVSYGEIDIQLTPEQLPLMSEEAASLQGWSLVRNAAATPFPQARQEFLTWTRSFQAIGYVAHNASFDRYHLERQDLVLPLPWYCTHKGFKLWGQRPGRTKPASHKLASLAEAAGHVNDAPHTAAADALAALTGYLWLVTQGVHPEDMRL